MCSSFKLKSCDRRVLTRLFVTSLSLDQASITADDEETWARLATLLALRSEPTNPRGRSPSVRARKAGVRRCVSIFYAITIG
jgi:hypothetical protein